MGDARRAALVLGALLLAACGGGEDAPATGSPAGTQELPSAAVWAVVNEPDPALGNFRFARVVRFSPDLGEREATLAAESDPTETQTHVNPNWMTACGGRVYVSSYGGNSIDAIDPRTLRVVGRARGRDFMDLACVDGGLWAMEMTALAVMRLAPNLDRIEAEIDLGIPPPSRMVSQGGELWVVDLLSGVKRIDTAANTAQTLRLRDDGLAYNLIGIAAVGKQIWVAANAGEKQALMQLDPASGQVQRRIFFGEANDIAVALGKRAQVLGAFGAVFLADPDSGGLVRLDPASGRVTCVAPVEGEITSLVEGPEAVYVGAGDPGALLRVVPADCSIAARVALDGEVRAIAVTR